jgi:excisionase family DNA binding protein
VIREALESPRLYGEGKARLGLRDQNRQLISDVLAGFAVHRANPTDAKRPVERSVDRILTTRGLPRTARMDRSEEYMEKLLLSPEEAAQALGVGRSRVYDLMRTRQLLSVRIGKSRRVPVAAVHAYVERLTEQDALV